MTEQPTSNIIEMKELPRQGDKDRSPGDPGLIESCRKEALEHLGNALSAMMDRLDDALFELAGKASDDATQTIYFDAMRHLRKHREAMEKGFLERYDEAFGRYLDGQGAAPGYKAGEVNELSLVDQEELEEKLAVTGMVTKVRNSHYAALYALDRRMGCLLRKAELDDDSNPLGPGAICESFHQVCRELDQELPIRLVILKLFDQYVISQLGPLYQEINRKLAAAGILPDIRPVVRKGVSPVRPQGLTGVGNLAASAPDQSLDGTAPLTGTGPLTGAAMVAPVVLANLNMLQHGQACAGLPSGFDVEQDGPTAVNIIRELRGTPVLAGLSSPEEQVLDMVTVLFDYILDDRNIPEPVKAQIARLQIPVLKVALVDRGLFAKKTHPARRLLNCLAEAGLGYSDDQINGRLLERVSEAVQRIIDEFEEDVALFDKVRESLEAYLEEERHQAELRAERCAKVIEGRERVERARTAAEALVSSTLIRHGDALPEFIRDFISAHWREALRLTHVREGDQSEAWKLAVKTLGALCWSCLPMESAGDRQRLVKLLPALLRNLNHGMDLAALPGREREAFLQRLAELHREQVRGREEREPPQVKLPAQENRPAAADEGQSPVGSKDQACDGDVQVPGEAADPGHAETAEIPIVSGDADRAAQALAFLGGGPLPEIDHSGEIPRPAEDQVEPAALDDTFGDGVEIEEIVLESDATEEMEELPEEEDEAGYRDELEHPRYRKDLESVDGLRLGDWLELLLDGGRPVRARLTWVSQATGTYLFTDRQGRKVAEKSRRGLVMGLQSGAIRMLDQAPLFDRALSRLSDTLGRRNSFR
ncbi:MAG: DUF1631 domain-containing protein [Gammaproteobacteria bacterium]|nr:MAG: DUF1631 domain-containing protein [Gammaproteobacteria bacterium]